MTGRELIMYILENNLENEEMFKDGKVAGFETFDEYAVHHNTGLATVHLWVRMGYIPHITIGKTVFIPANAEMRIPCTK